MSADHTPPNFALEESQHVWVTSNKFLTSIDETVFVNVARGVNKNLADAVTDGK